MSSILLDFAVARAKYSGISGDRWISHMTLKWPRHFRKEESSREYLIYHFKLFVSGAMLISENNESPI